MKTVHTLNELRTLVQAARREGRRIGFVPTMGNLHEGHISLIQRALDAHCFTVASVFVNPLQFDDKSDLARYPRTLPADQEKLAAAGCDLLFAPDVNEMYPNGQDQHSIVQVPVVSEGLCGGSRPGHFDGVSTVVTKLFNMVQPDIAFFGQKDCQQVAVIQKMVADLCMPIEIVPVPTARAESGLALSSRNGYLSAEELIIAPKLYQTLQEAAVDYCNGEKIAVLLERAKQRLSERGFKPDYVEMRRSADLAPAVDGDEQVVILAAAFLGSARLIDNLHTALNQVGE